MECTYMGGLWDHISCKVTDIISKELEIKRKNQLRKLEALKKVHGSSQAGRTHSNFYPRVVNNSTIKFKTPEITPLEKGLKYNLHRKPKNWMEKIAVEAETAINNVDVIKQDHLRHTVAEHLAKIQRNIHVNNNNNNNNREQDKQEWRTLKELKETISKHNLTITRADKGRTVVIMEQAQYDNKVMEFLHGIRAAKNDPTNIFQSKIKQALVKNEAVSHIKYS
jgi:hypothetical protein